MLHKHPTDALAAQLSAAAYTERAYQHIWSGAHVIESGNARALVAISESQQWVAVAGTDDPSDWIDDLSVSRKRTPWGLVHSGFWRHMEMIRSLVETELIPGMPVYLAGHSLGGAAASLLMPVLVDHGYPVSGLTTFGSPRVGDHAYARYMDGFSGIRRHVNNNDIATRVPGVWRGFRHFGTLVYHTSAGKTWQNPSKASVVFDRCVGRVRAVMDGVLDGLADHSMAKYLRRV